MAGKYYLGEEDRSALSEMIAAFRKDPTYYTTPNFINQDDTDNFNSECLIALTPEGGITPLDGVTVGYADCEIYRAVQTTTIGELDLLFCQYSVRVYNLNTEAVAGDTYIPIHKDKAGFWWTSMTVDTPIPDAAYTVSGLINTSDQYLGNGVKSVAGLKVVTPEGSTTYTILGIDNLLFNHDDGQVTAIWDGSLFGVQIDGDLQLFVNDDIHVSCGADLLVESNTLTITTTSLEINTFLGVTTTDFLGNVFELGWLVNPATGLPDGIVDADALAFDEIDGGTF